MTFRATLILTFIALIILPAVLPAQNGNGDKETISIFLNCWMCDDDFLRTEMPFVDFVIEQEEADVYILVTRRRTGGGGDEFTFAFLGQNDFRGVSDTLITTTSVDDTEDEERIEITRVLKLGLVRYVAQTALIKNLTVIFEEPEEGSAQTQEDNWNNWVFRLNMNGWFNGQSSSSSLNFNQSARATRVTEDWRIRFSANSNYNENNYEIDEDSSITEIKSITRNRGTNVYAIKSLTDHWSTGVWTNVSTSTYNNWDLHAYLRARIEYNYFPYSESTRRQLRFVYAIGPVYDKYTEETIYDKFSETLVEESFSIELELIQPWGEIDVELDASNYMHDFDQNEIQIFVGIEYRIFKGLNLNLHGAYSSIHNQRALVKGGASLEDVLLRRTELATQYNYFGSVGFSYTFGSIYNNIVNPRFGY